MDNKEVTEALGYLKAILEECTASEDAVSYVTSEDAGTLKAAIAALEQQEKAFDEWCTDCKEYDKEQHCCHRFTKVIRRAVEDHRMEWPDSKWIPVTENPKKPKYQFDTYLVYTKYERFGIADYFADGSWIGYDIDGDPLDGGEITAWMPLPEPYMEDEA